MKNSDFPLKVQIMNIAMNMGRAGNWAADAPKDKKLLINRFIQETGKFLAELKQENLSEDFMPTYTQFSKNFSDLKSEQITKSNHLLWAEKALTWANILQHRAKLA